MKRSTISKVLPVLLIAASIGAVLVTSLLKLAQMVAAQDYVEPSFCALSDGSIVYSIRDRSGGVLVRYDRLKKSRQVIARTPYLVTDVSASTDGRFIAYRYKFLGSSFGGIGQVNVATGAAQTFVHGQFAGYGAPVASPDGSHVLFKHWGRNTGGLSNAMRVLSEVDVKTGAINDIFPDGGLLSIQSPIYADENHILFAGERNASEDGNPEYDLVRFTRAGKTVFAVLPYDARLGLLGYSRKRHEYYALAETSEQQENHLTIIDEGNLADPSKWRSLPQREDAAVYSPGSNEILFASEEAQRDVVYSLTIPSSKARPIMALTNRVAPW